MSSEQDRVRLMAERIARRVSQSEEETATQTDENTNDVGEELAAVRATLSDLQDRLARIESHVTHGEEHQVRESRGARRSERMNAPHQENAPTAGTQAVVRSPWLSGMYVPATHPSQERFGVDEATLSELVDFFEKEKTCSLEPGGKPCDHCAMCSSRGF
jgi:hypothetical protein